MTNSNKQGLYDHLISKEVRDRYPVIRLIHMGDVWYPYLVHPDHLDIALCYQLGVDRELTRR